MAKKARAKKKARASLTSTMKVAAGTIVDELEKVSEAVVAEVREGFETVSGKVGTITKGAAGTVAETQVGHLLKNLADEVEEAGESLAEVVVGRLSQLRGRVVKQAETLQQTAKKKTKKAATKKKAKKKSVAKKKPSKKPAIKKKTAAKKKVAKQSTVKKSVAKKASKKTAKRKTTARKKTAAKRNPTKKRAT